MSKIVTLSKEARQRIIDIMAATGEPMTAEQIAEKAGLTPPAMTGFLKTLLDFGAICVAGDIKTETRKIRLYVVKPKLENVAPYRSKAPEGNLTGVDWDHAMSRPGCQDHLKHPSRRGSRLVMHGERMA